MTKAYLLIQHICSLRVRYIQLVTMTSKICHQEAAGTMHAVTCSEQPIVPVCKLYFAGSRQLDVLCRSQSLGHVVKQIDCCYQKCSSNTGSSKQKPEEQPDEASQHEAEAKDKQR